MRVARLSMALAALMALACLHPPTLSGQKKKTIPTIRVTVTVTDPSGYRVQGALVVLKQLRDHQGRIPHDPFDINTHTDEHGQVTVQGFEPGIVLVQVIDSSFNTWGQAFEMKKANENVYVKLKPPQSQVSHCCQR